MRECYQLLTSPPSRQSPTCVRYEDNETCRDSNAGSFFSQLVIILTSYSKLKSKSQVFFFIDDAYNGASKGIEVISNKFLVVNNL